VPALRLEKSREEAEQVDRPHTFSVPKSHETKCRLAVTPKRSNYRAGGTLILTGDFDPFALQGTERELVYKLADMMAELAASVSPLRRKSNEGRKGFAAR